jgi:hypothetical protein
MAIFLYFLWEAAAAEGFRYIQAMHSTRFNLPIILTRHAIQRMKERHISEQELLEVVDTGDCKFKDETHLWAYKHLNGRNDNLICAVLVLEDAVVVKTVMHAFTPED